jgi:anaerobic ribonucleoside-triphosphate reductase
VYDGRRRRWKSFTFPIPTYNITKDFDWNNPNHDLIWEMTAKYGIPYFSNFVNSDMNPEDARSMCVVLDLTRQNFAEEEEDFLVQIRKQVQLVL